MKHHSYWASTLQPSIGFPSKIEAIRFAEDIIGNGELNVQHHDVRVFDTASSAHKWLNRHESRNYEEAKKLISEQNPEVLVALADLLQSYRWSVDTHLHE